jgi:hypothetical protein
LDTLEQEEVEISVDEKEVLELIGEAYRVLTPPPLGTAKAGRKYLNE